MTRSVKMDMFAFLDRCVEDTGRGTLYLSKADREHLRKDFGQIGRDVRRGFAGLRDLLRTYLETLPPERFYVVYETARLLDPTLADPLDDFARFPGIARSDYLAIRILAKLHVLGLDLDHPRTWMRDHVDPRYLSAEGGLDFDDEALILELDRELALRVTEVLARDQHLSPPRT